VICVISKSVFLSLMILVSSSDVVYLICETDHITLRIIRLLVSHSETTHSQLLLFDLKVSVFRTLIHAHTHTYSTHLYEYTETVGIS